MQLEGFDRVNPIAGMYVIYPHKDSPAAVVMRLGARYGEDAAWRVVFKRSRNRERYRRMLRRRDAA